MAHHLSVPYPGGDAFHTRDRPSGASNWIEQTKLALEEARCDADGSPVNRARMSIAHDTAPCARCGRTVHLSKWRRPSEADRSADRLAAKRSGR